MFNYLLAWFIWEFFFQLFLLKCQNINEKYVKSRPQFEHSSADIYTTYHISFCFYCVFENLSLDSMKLTCL